MNNNNQNIDKAKEWFLKAAREGSYEALYKLGQMLDPNEQSKSKCVRRAINHYEITKVIIPNSVIEIGFREFYGCESLQNIVIPDSVTEIGESALASCDSLHKITMPKKLKNISIDRITKHLFYNKPYNGVVEYY